MKDWAAALGLAVALGLTGCGTQSGPVPSEYAMEIKSVAFPASVAATAPLAVLVEVTVGGCQSFKRFEAERRAGVLQLRAIGSTQSGLKVACPAIIGWEKRTYTDPGTPARTDPFEIVVNGASYGTVSVQADVASP
ncbi:hypothetical protein E7T09_02675 [Deinococcus sp. KSM4-11]|uniref:hypothetical protein n=1 Tax=Deinococcus sp. KSM4-11 TaxID=2568654 RepID=UPI0010A2B2F9|nr:hypothetical protein [Deinococcus sp. KSM4-11]THF88139.1 hypothetical protein E7T09_02675 [Deinococcus sp. KSM4-11]